jgi:predicted TIM-barrel fold metal-dependent hydrolase
MIVDAHVHLFPPRVLEAIWRWFDRHAWKVAHQIHAEKILEQLANAGVDRVVGLAYSHVPDMARSLNRFMSELARAHPAMLIPLGTVLPGEPDAAAIMDEALGPLGLRGFKIHCHVQRMAPDDARLDPVYVRATEAGVPIVMHAGRAPCLEGYGIRPDEICSAAATRRALQRHPRLTLVVPHLGDDEEDAYFAMLDEFPNLYLDTTMMLADYFAVRIDPGLLERHADRILFGTDFPNIPYEYGRERAWLEKHVAAPAREKIIGANALRLFG